MEISKEQKEAIEYLEKYTKWETYGERNLEKDIITVLELLKETQIKNETLEKLLQGNLYEMYKYYRDLANSYQGNCISKEKVKDKLKKLKIEKEIITESLYKSCQEAINTYKLQIKILQAQINNDYGNGSN